MDLQKPVHLTTHQLIFKLSPVKHVPKKQVEIVVFCCDTMEGVHANGGVLGGLG